MKQMTQWDEVVPALVLMAMVLIVPESAFAGANPMGTTLCAVVRWFTDGTVGFGLVALGFCIFAVAMVLNKITWPIVILGLLDAAVMFSADWFVVEFGGTACPPA
jgi:hypothetical protein